jgi:hypothetical protein
MLAMISLGAISGLLTGFTFGKQALVFIPLIWGALSVYVINNDEIASMKMFGAPVKNIHAGSGLTFAVYGIFEVTKYPYSAQQKQYPGDPEEIFKGPDSDPLPSKQVRALRITTGKPAKEVGENNPLAIQMALEFLYFLRVQITDPLTFEVKYGSLGEFWRQIRDTGDKLLNEEVTQTPGVAKLIEKTPELMDKLKTAFQEACEDGGIRLIESGISAPDLTHKLSEAIRDVGVIRAEAAAEAGKVRRLGDASADAAAAMIRKTSEELEKADDYAKAAYVGDKVLSDKTIILGDSGMSQVWGLAETFSKGIAKNGGET